MENVLTAPAGYRTLALPARRLAPLPTSSAATNTRSLGARIAMTAPATERLLRMIEDGGDEYVIMSADGRISVRARLSIESVDCVDQCLANSSVVVDWSRATISNEGNCVRLSRTEMRLLSGLLENNGQAVRRATLIERAWPRRELQASESENALAVYICALRKRLAAIGLASSLQTVRGVGYRIAL